MPKGNLTLRVYVFLSHIILEVLESLYQLIKGCIERDNKSQQVFYEHYYGFALKTVFRYIYKYDKATDVVNDSFVKIFNSLEKFQLAKEKSDTEKILMGWMKRILINTAIDELRKQQVAPEIGELPEYIWEEMDRSQNADQKLLYKELICEVKRLPPSYRNVFNMFVIDGFSHNEIAKTLGISEGTSKSALAKAKAQLKKFLENRISHKSYAIQK
jgi:RNA polymerase sigma factor (sigma-70 family)